jgi:WD40 repeat protein
MEPFAVEIKPTYSNLGKSIFNPFPGLRPFTTDESHLFFGREGQSQEVLKYLAENRFVALMGTSGSGKSSLMYCGVIPILQGGFITKAGVDWKIITTRPGQSPVRNLANALAVHLGEESEDSELQKEYLYTTLSASSVGLTETLKTIPRKKSQNILLLVDQFEELFRFRKIKNSTEAYNEVISYIKLLLESLQQKEVPVYIVITMRSDFIGECAQFQELTKLINDSHYLIPQMTRDDFREAIEGPIAVGGGKITHFLVQQLLNDLGDNPDQLPILQHALMRTWDSWIKSGNTEDPIDIKDYENIGRLEKALSEHANEAYNELNQDQKEVCQSIFKTLTEKGGDNRGVRRPTAVNEIAEIANVGPDQIIDVVEHFRLAGRSFLAPQPPVVLNNDSVIDISHESLMRIWDKMILWVGEEYDAVAMYKRLAVSAEKYQQGESGLWRPPDLLLALNWKEKQKPSLTWAKRHNPAFERTMVFLETSQSEYQLEEENKIKQQKRALVRTRIFAIVLGTASIISLFFMIDSFIAKREALTQKIKAEEQTEIATQERSKAEEQTKIAEDQKSLAQQKEQEALVQKELADKEKRNAQASAYEANRQQKIAIQKSQEATEQRSIAVEKAEEAKKQQLLAEEASERAQQLRMLSISQSMAVKSLQIDIDTTLRALVAYQSYLLNKQYKGNEFNPDVYNGMYFAQKYLYGSKETDFLKHTYQVKALSNLIGTNGFFSAGSDGAIVKWNIDDNRAGELFFNTNNTNRTLSLSPDGNAMLCGLNTGELLYFNLTATPTQPEILFQFNSAVTASNFSGENYIVACDNLGNTCIIDRSTKAVELLDAKLFIKELIPYKSGYIALNKSGLLLIIQSFKPLAYETYQLEYAVGGKTGSLKKADITLENYGPVVNSFAISTDQVNIALGDLNGNVLVFQLNDLKFLNRLTGQSARINSLDFSMKSNYLASASNDGSVLVWKTSDYNLAPYQLKDNDAWVLQVKFIQKENLLFAAYADGKIRKWNLSLDELAQNIKPKISRNFTVEEWQQYLAKDIDYNKTIPELP